MIQKITERPSSSRSSFPKGRSAFTLVELLVVIALIGILSSILMSALAKARTRAQAIFCMNNTHELGRSWFLYSEDNDGHLANNFGGGTGANRLAGVGGRGGGMAPSDLENNWVNNVMDWSTSSDNTNIETITHASLGPYTQNFHSYHCPADNVLGSSQQAQGWEGRIRSYSMNAMMGDAGTVTASGVNANVPTYTQYFRITSIAQPSEVFVFLDEHPDSINDGYFVNNPLALQWTDLPANYHNGAAAFSFADMHSELHQWGSANTKRPNRAGGAGLPFTVSATDTADFSWMAKHMSARSY